MRARLLSHSLKRESESTRLRPQLELDLPDSRRMIGPHVKDAFQFTQTMDYRACNLIETFRVRMRQHRLNRIAQVEDLAAESNSTSIRQDTHLVAPRLCN